MNLMTQTSLISLSQRVYRTLLILYPVEYRREYGALMAQVFRDMCRDTYRARGTTGIVLWWCTTLLDLALTAFEQRRKAGIPMHTVSLFLRRVSGVLLIAGGLLLCIASAAELQPGMNYPLRGIYQVFGFLFGPAIVLLALGTIGLALKYQHSAGSLGRLGLYGAVGGVLVIVAYMIIVLITRTEHLWNMFLGGFLLHATGLIVFGLTALKAHPLPRGNWLPILIGVTPFLMLIYNPKPNGVDTEWENIAAYILMGVGYAALGYIMHREPAKAVTPALA
jgi:hypothetical protein